MDGIDDMENLVKSTVADMEKIGNKGKDVEKTRVPTPHLLRTWKPTAAGILDTVTGVFAIVCGLTLTLGTRVLSPMLPLNTTVLSVVLFVLGAGATVGGIYALTRGRWVFAVVGAVCAATFIFPLGIPAIIFTSLSKDEFERLR